MWVEIDPPVVHVHFSMSIETYERLMKIADKKKFNPEFLMTSAIEEIIDDLENSVV